MVARAQLPADLRLPVRHIPLQALGRDTAWFLQGDDPDIFAEDLLVALLILPHLDTMHTRLKEECQAGSREEEDATAGVGSVLLEEVQMMQLAQSLVDAATDATQRDDVQALRMLGADPSYSLAEVRGVLVSVMDDLSWGRLRGIEIADGGVERVEVADDDLQI